MSPVSYFIEMSGIKFVKDLVLTGIG